MFHGIKLPHRSSTRPAENQPLLPKGSGQAQGSPSSQAHHELTGRGSPGTSAGAMAPRGNPFLKRSDALSAQAQAHAYAAYQRPNVHFAPEAQVIQDGQRPRNEPMNFGAKPKPQRIGRPSTPAAPVAAAPAPAPAPPASPARPEGKHSFFGGLFHRPGSSSPPKRTETSAPAAQAAPNRPADTLADKFNGRLSQFLAHHPDEALKHRLVGHLAAGNLNQFSKEAAAASMTMTDRKSYALLQSMVRTLNQMGEDDYLNLRINAYRPKRSA